MQEEQRSLSSVETLSVFKLLMDESVRWQVLTVVVINIGMQLSGIDAVSTLNNNKTKHFFFCGSSAERFFKCFVEIRIIANRKC